MAVLMITDSRRQFPIKTATCLFRLNLSGYIIGRGQVHQCYRLTIGTAIPGYMKLLESCMEPLWNAPTTFEIL